MGAQFSEEFLLGYRAGHRDGFADAVLLMRDVVTPHWQARALARRVTQFAQLLSGEARGVDDGQTAKGQAAPGEVEGALTALQEAQRMRGHGAGRANGTQSASHLPIHGLPERG